MFASWSKGSAVPVLSYSSSLPTPFTDKLCRSRVRIHTERKSHGQDREVTCADGPLCVSSCLFLYSLGLRSHPLAQQARKVRPNQIRLRLRPLLLRRRFRTPASLCPQLPKSCRNTRPPKAAATPGRISARGT